MSALAILDARLRILVLDDEVRVRNVELQQLARRELMIEPVDRAVLQVGQRIVPRRARQLVLGRARSASSTRSADRRDCRDGLPSFQSPRSTVWPP